MKSCIVDTNILLNDVELEEYEKIYCSIVVLEEIDKLKTSENPSRSFKARQAMRKINELKDKFIYIMPNATRVNILDLDITRPDNRIVLSALHVQETLDRDAIMLTQDLNMIEKCRALGIRVRDFNDYKAKEIFKGYKFVKINTDDELAYFYENLDKNIYDLSINEYILVKDKTDDVVSILKWNGEEHIELSHKKFTNKYIGEVKPFDVVQRCAFDSISTNNITCLFGRSGSGKTILSLGYALSALENGNINKIYMLSTCKELKGSEPIGLVA